MRDFFKKYFFSIILIILFLQFSYCQEEYFSKLKKVYEYDHSLPLNPQISQPVDKGSYYEYKIYYESMNNQKIPALLLIPKITDFNKKFGPPWPVVFVMHFHGSDKTLANIIADNFVKFGIALFSIDGVFKGERAQEGKDPMTPNPQESISNIKQQTFDILRGVDFLETCKEINKNKIGFLGISLGAITGAVATGVDERFKFIVLADGAADLYTLFRYSDGAYDSSIVKTREYILEKKISPENLRGVYKEVDPLYFVSHISPRPLLLLNGRKDTTMSIPAIKILHQIAREPKKIIWYDTDHILPFDLVGLDSLRFFYTNFTGEKIRSTFSWIEEEKMRAVYLEDLSDINKFKEAGINTILYRVKISFDEKENIKIQNIDKEINVFPVIDYAGEYELKNIKEFNKYVPSSGYPSSFTPCPGNLSFWKKTVIERVLRLLNSYKVENIKGILVNLEMAGDKSYYRTECVCDDCFSRYLNKIKSKEEIKNIPLSSRMEFLTKNGYLLDYREELEKRIEQIINNFFKQAQRIDPNLIFGFLSYDNNWFYHGIIKGFSRAGTPVLILTKSAQDEGYSKFILSQSKRLKEENENLVLIPGISLKYFLPEEIPGQIYKTGCDFSGYYLIPEEINQIYLSGIKLANQEISKSIKKISYKSKLSAPLYSGPQNITARVAIIYSNFQDYAYREVYHQALEEFEVSFDEYENSNLSSLIYQLKNYDAVLTTPFWNSVSTFDLSKYKEEIIQFLKEGGIFFVNDANSENNISWLKKFGENFYLEIEECKGGLSEIKKGHPVLEESNRIREITPGTSHFINLSLSWEVLAKCSNDKPFLVLQNIGKGVLAVSTSFAPTPPLMENFWEYLVMQRAGVILEDVNIPQAHFGDNKLKLKVRNREDKTKIKVICATLNEHSENIIDLEKEEEKELEVNYKTLQRGEVNLYLILSSLDNSEVYARHIYKINVPPLLQIKSDKSFYTEEKEIKIFIKIDESEKFLKGKKIIVKSAEEKKEIVAKTLNEVFLNIRDLPLGKILIGVELFGKNKIISDNNIEVYKLKPIPGMAKINYEKENILEVDDKPFFPIGIYSIPEQELKELRETGFNCTVNYNTSPSASLSYLEKAKEYGVKVIPYAIYLQRLVEEKNEEELKEFLNNRKAHPSLLGWYLVDEPELNNQSPELIDKLNKFVKEIDPYHPTTLVIADSNKYRDYAECSDVFMIDPYPIPGGEEEGKIESVSFSAEKANLATFEKHPVWCIPQSFDWAVWKGKFKEGDKPRPTPEELRNMTYQAIVGGAKGIIYWAYRASRYYIRDYPTTWEGLKKVVGELNQLTPILLSKTSEINISMPYPSRVKFTAKEYQSKIYLFAVNLDRKEKKIKFLIPSAKDSEINVLFEDRKINVKNGEFEDIFKPIDVHIYEFSLDKK